MVQEIKQCVKAPLGLPRWLSVKDLPANAEDAGDAVPSLSRADPLRKWQLTPVFLPGKSHGQRSWMHYSPGGGRAQRV